MKRKAVAIVLCALLAAMPCSSAFADEKDDKIAELEAQIAEMQETIDRLQAQIDELTASSDLDAYGISDTWAVAGQWNLTIDSIEEMTERNEYADTDPAAVYLVTYTYENVGYSDPDEIMNGLFLGLDLGVVVDAAGSVGYSYPNDVVYYPSETPIGATCQAQVCIGVDNPGDFEIHFSQYDGSGVEQTAVFSCPVE